MFCIEDHGTICLVRPLTLDVATWLAQHTDGQWYGRALVVEHRFVDALVGGMIDEGFVAS